MKLTNHFIKKLAQLSQTFADMPGHAVSVTGIISLRHVHVSVSLHTPASTSVPKHSTFVGDCATFSVGGASLLLLVAMYPVPLMLFT